MRRNSGIIGPIQDIKEIDERNGVYDIFDAYNYKLADTWPYGQKFVSASMSPGTVISEGSSLVITVIFDGFVDGELAYYTINTVSGPTMTSADFVGGISGSFVVTGNVGVLTLTLVAGDGTENNQFNVDVREESISGRIFFTSSTVTVTDVADVVGQANFLSPGTFNWTCPGGVTSVCVLAIGGGGGGIGYSCCYYGMMGGAGGGLGWKNGYSVTPNSVYTVVVGAGGINGGYSQGSQSGGDSYFVSTSVVKGGYGRYGRYSQHTPDSSYAGDGGGSGGGSEFIYYSYGPGGGGGAGGYSGNGGKGRQTTYGVGYAGSGGGAGGNGGSGTNYVRAYSGGGVGIYGEGSSGNSSGGGGSGGTSGDINNAGVYGGGGGGSTNGYSDSKPGQGGAVRIIWGSGLSYPSTLTTDQ